MPLRHIILFIILLFFSIAYANAQAYIFDVSIIGIKDGLPEREVYDIVIDKKGYLWISIQGAISRYDGNQFKTYTSQELNINEYNSTFLAVDDKDNIWYVEHTDINNLNYSGVLNPTTDSIFTLEKYTNGLLNSNDVTSLNYGYQDATTWFLTTRQGIIYQYKNGDFEKVYTEKGKINSPIYFEPISKTEGFVLHQGKIISLENNQPRDSFDLNMPHNVLTRMLQRYPSLVLESITSLGDHNNFWEFKDNQLVPYQTTDKFSYQRVLQLESDFNTFFKEDSIIIRADNHQLLFKQKNPLGVAPDKGLYLKKQDILFLRSANGLLKITRRKNPFQSFDMGKNIWGYYPEKITADWMTDLIQENPPINFPKTFKGEKQLWIGTSMNKIIAYKEHESPVIYQSKEDTRQLWIPHENKQTKRLWIGTSTGLAYLDETSKQVVSFDLPNINKDLAVRHFHQNKKGIWILTSDGIFLMDAHSERILKHYTIADGLPYPNYMHLHEDADGVFWLATKGGGLIRWEVAKNNIEQFTKAKGLSHNVLYAVYEDANENLWLPSNYGLMQFNKNTFSTKVFLPQNGSLHEEFNTFEHAQAADGTLYLGNLGGAISFHPNEIQQVANNYEPPLHLTSVRVLDANVDKFRDITETYQKNNSVIVAPNYQTLELELSLLDYKSVKDKQYAYQIEGYQDQWVYTKENTISIFKIPYGTYQVKLKAREVAGVWTEKIVTFSLTVTPPFYYQSWFLIGLFILFGLGILGFIKRREINLQKDKERLTQEVKKRTAIIETQTEELKQLDKAKTSFFANITHEFRTPLTLVIGPLQQMIKAPSKEITPQRLQTTLKNAQQILHLINQLLDISKLESGKMKLEISHGNIIAYTQELIDNFQDIAQQNKQRLVFHTKEAAWTTHFDKNKWNKIIYNIISNAIKFTPTGGAIQISLAKLSKKEEEWLHLKVKDSGVGIHQNQLPQIFNRFYQVDDSSTRQQEGTGIGLALVKELVELQNGEIWVTSEINIGTTFDIQIPIPKGMILDHQVPLVKEEIPTPPVFDKSATSVAVINEPIAKEEGVKLLIIEDNKEMLAYIQSCLDGEKYTIYTAMNGEEGIQKAQALIPDLIVSDVMMPIKDGFEVTQTLRQQLATSHVPIILLTAKAALESKLKGLERGADAYLTKPFSPEELRLRIQKLIELRQLLQQRYQNKEFAKETKTNQYKKEDVFIQSIKEYIHENIEDSGLNGEIIGKRYGISRMQLHRKLKALTNQTTSQFIQNIRLEKAYELLSEKELNVTEVAYQTGFNHPNHFSRVFKKKYGKAPSKV